MAKKKITAFKFNREEFDDQETFIRAGRRCATPVPTDLQINRVDREVAALRRVRARVEKVSINIQFTHITNGSEGAITEEQRVQQVAVLSDAFKPHGIDFVYHPSTVKIVDKPSWFEMGHRSFSEREAKTALHIAPEYNLNFYTAGLQSGLLGWATFPLDLAGDRVMDGVVILHTSLPGGSGEPYNLGYTAVHEVGHWLGLYHTFQGGCDAHGDQVGDTEAHSGPNYGCPEEGTHNACPGEERAPIRNFMNYVDDACMDRFTVKQGARTRDQIGAYRSGLLTVIEDEADIEKLILGTSVSGTLSGDEDEKAFTVELPTKATISVDGPGGVDFDLYIKRGSRPTTSDYDLRGYTPGPDEILQIAPGEPSRYYIVVRSYKGSGEFTLSVELG